MPTGQVFIGSRVEAQPTVFGGSATFQQGIATGSAAGGQPPSVTTPAVPASNTAVTNGTGVDVVVYITGGTSTAVKVNGTTVLALTPATVYLPSGATISVTYSVAPTGWVWLAV